MSLHVSRQRIEELTLRLGHEMFDRMADASPSVFQAEWWQELGLRQCMKNEWLKVQAFRFIDVLPTVGYVPSEIARHLREYFVRRRNGPRSPLAELDDAPAAQRLIALAERVCDFDDLSGWRARLLARAAWQGALKMAGRFIAGTTIEQAERAIVRLRDRQMAFTIDVLGEAALSRSEAEAYQATYLDLITELPRHARGWHPVPLIDEGDGVALPRVNVSVKLTSLHPGLDAIAPQRSIDHAKEMLRPLLRQAMAGSVHIHIDMEHYAIKDLTLQLCEQLLCEPEFRDYPHFGIVLQAYLKDGDRDVQRTVAWAKRRGTPVWVRLVKGAYWDSETVWAAQAGWPCPVWQQKWQSDACYERMTRVLLANWRHTPAAFASHNVRSLAHAMALKQLWDVPDYAFELQMLYGMGDPIKYAAVDMGYRCRIYTPYGQLLPGMAYLIRRLLENTANEGFLRSATEDTPREVLLRDPEQTGRQTPPYQQPIIVKYEFEEPIMDPFENVPNTDFAREDARRAMQAGLANARAAAGCELPMRIGGQTATSDQWVESRNPSRPAELVARAACAGQSHVDQAVAGAQQAFAAWRDTEPRQRAAAVMRAAELMQERRFDLAGLLVFEVGMPWRQADAEVSQAIDYCNYYAKEAIRISDHARRRDIPGETNEYAYMPRGVTAVLGPWNSPLASVAGMAAAALVTGNPVIIKPSSRAPAIGARLVELLWQAGLPPTAVSFLPGAGTEIGAALAAHPGVATVAAACRPETAEHLHRGAGATLTNAPGYKRLVVSAGGNNPVIVDSDADLDEAIKAIKESAFGFAGQRCSSARRCIVLESIEQRFVERLTEAVRGVSIGPADDPATFVPPLIDQSAAEAASRLIDETSAAAECVLRIDADEAVRASDGAAFVGPAVFTRVDPQAAIATRHLPGPLLAIVTARDFAEAVELFNRGDYSLCGGVFSRSPANIDHARRCCECGNLFINRKITDPRVDLQPFGGWRLSGAGIKTGGPDYLIQFTQPRSITENTLRRGFAPNEEVAETVG